MELTVREFILIRIAEDEHQASVTAAAAWDHAGQMKTAHDHRNVLATLTTILEAHVPNGSVCEDCRQAWPCRTVRTIARTWREHDAFNEAWLGEP